MGHGSTELRFTQVLDLKFQILNSSVFICVHLALLKTSKNVILSGTPRRILVPNDWEMQMLRSTRSFGVPQDDNHQGFQQSTTIIDGGLFAFMRQFTIRPFCLVALTAFLAFALSANAQNVPRGLWLLRRHDPQNTARAEIPGAMKTAPTEVWRYGGDSNILTALFPVILNGGDAYLAQIHSGLRLLRHDGTTLWNLPKLGVTGIIG